MLVRSALCPFSTPWPRPLVVSRPLVALLLLVLRPSSASPSAENPPVASGRELVDVDDVDHVMKAHAPTLRVLRGRRLPGPLVEGGRERRRGRRGERRQRRGRGRNGRGWASGGWLGVRRGRGWASGGRFGGECGGKGESRGRSKHGGRRERRGWSEHGGSGKRRGGDESGGRRGSGDCSVFAFLHPAQFSTSPQAPSPSFLLPLSPLARFVPLLAPASPLDAALPGREARRAREASPLVPRGNRGAGRAKSPLVRSRHGRLRALPAPLPPRRARG